MLEVKHSLNKWKTSTGTLSIANLLVKSLSETGEPCPFVMNGHFKKHSKSVKRVLHGGSHVMVYLPGMLPPFLCPACGTGNPTHMLGRTPADICDSTVLLSVAQ